MVKTYDCKKVLMAFGNHAVTGWADDSFITISSSGDGFTKKTGCDGEVVRSVSPDKTYSIKLSLLQTSESNTWMQNRYNMDRETGEGMFPVLIKDLMGGLLFSAEQAWVVKPADRGYGKEAGNREWQIDTGEGYLEE